MQTAQGARPLLLLFDRENLLEGLAEKMADHGTVVLVTQKNVQSEKDIVLVPFVPPFPQIPDGLYSSMMFVWEQKLSYLLDPLMQKAKETNAHLFLIVTNEEKESIPKDLPNVTIFVLGDLFDEVKQFPLTKFLMAAKEKKKMQLANMGLHEWYPMRFADALEKIKELTMAAKREHVRYFIGPAHPYTALTLAHGLQKTDPDLIVDFLGEKEPYINKSEPISAFATYDSIKRLQEVYRLLVVRHVQEVKEMAQAILPKKNMHKKKGIGWGLYLVYLILLALILPVAVAFGSAGLGIYLLSSSMHDLQRGSFDAAYAEAKAAQQNLSLSQGSFDLLIKETGVIGQSRFAEVLEKKITTGVLLSQVAQSGIQSAQSLSKILSGKTLTPEVDANTAVSSMKEGEVLLQGLDASSLPQQYQQLIVDVKQVSGIVSGISDTLPQVLGIGGTKTYLVLFQNNMELRPGGGFIGSYGLLRLQNGALKDFSIHDVYDADGQLKGHVEPPFAIRRYIPLVHLYLRDSNFDPDFVSDGQAAALLLSQETGDRVDGVIGIDLDSLKALLGSVGNVYVPSYNQTVTEQNFFTTIEQHAEKNFFPGSTQKKDFLRSFASALLAKLEAGSVSLPTLLSRAVDLLQGKHVLVSFANTSLQSPYSFAGLSGSLTDTRSSSSATLNDYLGVVEANLGVNKANAFVTRQLTQNISVASTGDVAGAATLILNNASDGTWPGGVYRNYVRFLLPQNAVITGISLNNVEQNMVPAITDPKIYEAKSFTAPKGLEVEKDVEAGKNIYGFLVTVPVEGNLSVKVSYTIPRAFTPSQQKQTYDVLVWKQPGVESYPYQLTFTIPDNYAFLKSNASYVKNGQSATIDETIKKDAEYSISFGMQ